jgi:hypothetical protein
MIDFPPPPSVTPRQMDILRAATAMAWADGQLEPAEIQLMLEQFVVLFAKSESQQATLRVELQEYLGQNIPLEQVIPSISNASDRRLVLKLGYQVIWASRRTPDESLVNMDEAAAYQKLIGLLGFTSAEVTAIESEISAAATPTADGKIADLAVQLHTLIA